MATKVYVTYTASLNVSTTTRDGVVSRITTWTTGNPKSTEVVFSSPADPR